MFIIDVCLALISTPTRGVVIRKNILARVSQSLPPTPTRGVVIRTEQAGVQIVSLLIWTRVEYFIYLTKFCFLFKCSTFYKIKFDFNET